MDFSKIFIKNANPTKMGGQAVMEGIMMKGADRTAIAVRRGDGTINVKEQPIAPKSKWAKIPIIRGVVVFIDSLITGTKTLMYSAEVLEEDIPTDQQEEMSKFDQWLLKTFGEKGFFNILLYSSVVLALVFSVGLFVLLPTWVVGLLGKVVESANVPNELYQEFMTDIAEEIDRENKIIMFQYHGAEHRTIHCFENGLELTPENCMQFESLHPRCGTSFLVFVMFISLLLFSFLGWPNVWVRLLSRLVLIPLVAGISFEVLKWAGSTDNMLVKILSVPGLYMQKLTTKDPDIDMIEGAIVAVKACLSDEPPVERIYDVDSQGNKIDRKKMKAEQAREKAVSEATDADLMSFAAEDDLFKAESISKE